MRDFRFILLITIAVCLWGCAEPRSGLSEGDMRPDFTFNNVDGKPIALSEFGGKPLVLSLFATWCTPCNEEMPELLRLYEQHKDKLHVVAISQGEDAETVRPYVEEKKITFPVLLDPEIKSSDAFRGNGIPRLAIIDKTGKIRGLQESYSPESFKSAEKLALKLAGE